VRRSPRGQDTLFNAIRAGGCRNDNDLRASSTALVNAEAQLPLMPGAPPPPTKEDRDLANAFEAHVERVATLLRSGIHENQIVTVRKTSPHRAGTLADLLADLLAAMQTDLRRIEVGLRGVCSASRGQGQAFVVLRVGIDRQTGRFGNFHQLPFVQAIRAKQTGIAGRNVGDLLYPLQSRIRHVHLERSQIGRLVEPDYPGL